MLWKPETTENALALELLEEALSSLGKTCSVRVFTQCAHVLSTVNNHWLPQWEKRGWVNARGKLVGNAGLWQQVYRLMQNHFVEACPDSHAYQTVMRHDIKRKLEEHRAGRG